MLFNSYIYLRVIYMLISEQRNVSKSLREIMQQTHDRLFSNTPDELDSLNSNGRKNSIVSDQVRKRLGLNLLVMQKFNSAAIRIALYPLAPVAWWVINSIYYGVQYSITMTYQSDVDQWVRLVSLAWFSMPAIAIANFIAFVTDPAFVKVVKSVHGRLSSMFWSYINRWERRSAKGSEYKECIHASSAKNRHFSGATLAVDDTATMFGTDDHDTLSGATAMPVRCKYRDELPFELSASGSADNNLGAIERNIDSASDECSSSMSDAPAPLVGSELRDGQMSQTSAAISTYGDMIRRHPTTGSGTHANRFYSKI
ncbi:hypothetical protein EV175_002559 [Coemansia sp. RSA 1933]|nr:hypothetical protein EV175_002559 [Coemansia sp. RSA 1933]